MEIGEKGLNLIKKFEGFRSKPYLCQAGKPTLGYGSTYYANGKKVSLSDSPINEQQATLLLKDLLKGFEKTINTCVHSELTQNQFDALCSFVYNIGETRFKTSTLLKKVNANPNDLSIKAEFLKWKNVKGKPILLGRRQLESQLYFLI
ncbi:MAG: hypothetical protein RIR01_2087 [Bacteroidota bacterium]|jgi:lysozyme